MSAATKVLHDPRLDETVFRRVFRSGLTVYVSHKPDFTKSYATLAARYGSIDTRVPGRRKPLPDGIAHFLEHTVFATPEGDAFALFAARGASANAFTSFSSTRYLFGTSREYEANLRTLLDMVLELHVTPGSVEKERGIIGQEIAMYDDDPDWRIYFGALQALYARNPVRLDIAGTTATIAGIDPDLLHAVHRAYYHPRNLTLCAVSPEPPAATFRAVEACVESRDFGPPPPLQRTTPREPRRVHKERVSVRLPVARPRVILACKDVPPARRGAALLRQELASALALDCLFGNSGRVFTALYEKGLVDENFACSYTADPVYAFAMVGAETDDVGKLRRALEKEVDRALADGIGAAEFERVRNKELGGYARAFNAPERIAHALVGHHFRGTTIPQYREMLLRMSRATLNKRLRALLAPEARCYSLVLPR